MPGWLAPTFLLLPYAAWMFLGVGIPWALALLPRDEWRDRISVITVGLALGPVGFTTVLFVLGTVARITFAGTLAGSVLLAAVGAFLAWRNTSTRGAEEREHHVQPPLTRFEWFLASGIGLVLLANVIITAYWPFVAYDPLWVYAYNAKIFIMQQDIPRSMGYYPQLVPLGYTAMQQAWHAFGGALFNDHAARVIIPWFNGSMVLMAYLLGRRAFGSRRVGLLTAAVWSFYPHVAAWGASGDLEIPLTLYVTGAALFFIEAWRSERARLAILSGVLLSGALWTKPTGGALALGVMLAVAGWMVVVRFQPAAVWPRFRIALLAGLACAPIGGMWYLRNLVLGHTAVVFPASYWHDSAQRSGQEFGWPLLIALLGAVWLLTRQRLSRSRRLLILLALALLLIGILPTALNLSIFAEHSNPWQWARGDLPSGRRLMPGEVALIAAGFGLLAWQLRGMWRRRETVLLIWALLLPYGTVWFFDFSYHYRLSFAIVPLLAVQVAALIDGGLWPWLERSWIGRGAGIALAGGALALTLAVGLEFTATNRDLPDDTAKYDVSNPALMDVVHMLERYAAEHGDPVVVIPGEDRLPFFFPTWDIRNSRDPDDLPTRIEDIAGADIFVDGSVVRFLMRDAGKLPNSLIAEAEVGAAYSRVEAQGPNGKPWPTVLQPIPLNRDGSLGVFDGSFLFMAYSIHPDARTTPMNPIAPQEPPAIIGGFAEFVGHNITRLDWTAGSTIFLSLYWRPVDQAAQDYSVYVHLLDADGHLLAQWDSEPMQGQYPTHFWRPGESIMDYRDLHITGDIPPGPAQLRVGLYDPLTGERLPVTVNGEPAGDGLTINTRIVIK